MKPTIDEIRARWAAATPGPWVIGPDGAYNAVWGADRATLVASVEGEADEDAIAAAPEDIKTLLARIDELETLLRIERKHARTGGF